MDSISEFAAGDSASGPPVETAFHARKRHSLGELALEYVSATGKDPPTVGSARDEDLQVVQD
jgi:hypothetical protein